MKWQLKTRTYSMKFYRKTISMKKLPCMACRLFFGKESSVPAQLRNRVSRMLVVQYARVGGSCGMPGRPLWRSGRIDGSIEHIMNRGVSI